MFMCGIAEIEKPSPKAKLETERGENLAESIRKMKNKYTTLNLPSVFLPFPFFAFHFPEERKCFPGRPSGIPGLSSGLLWSAQSGEPIGMRLVLAYFLSTHFAYL